MDSIVNLQFKRKIKSIQNIKGNGTSMITLLISPDTQISKINHKLIDEFGKCSNIKSRINRQSVETALKTAQAKLKMYNRLPQNGLALFCGNGIIDNKEKTISLAIEPINCLISSLYKCDDNFHTEELEKMLKDNDTYGFIIVDGNGVLYATLSGQHKIILESFTVDLPSKHGRGGQSALRFARLRLEAHQNYIRKVIEQAIKIFITNDKVNVKGIIFGGSAQFKDKIIESNIMDLRLKSVIIGVFDIAYGGENGFEQTIEQSSSLLSNVKYVEEKKILLEYFQIISTDGNYIFGMKETLNALKNGIIDTLIVYDNLQTIYPELVDGEQILVIDWLLEHSRDYGTKLYPVSENTSQGSQFVNGFGGIGGILRYKINEEFNPEDNDDMCSENDDFI